MAVAVKIKSGLRRGWGVAPQVARWVLGLVGVLLLLRLALPFILKAYVNRQLDRSTEYDGRVGDIDVNLWRGAYEINDVVILKTTGVIPEPFFAATKVDLSVQWRELFHGAVVGEIVMRQPQLNFVMGPNADQTQTGKNTRWDKMLESLFPFRFNHVEITDGQVHFQNHHSSPPVDIFVDALSATATNLSNTRDLKMELPAGVTARGRTLGSGEIDLQLQMNPLAATPTFEVTVQLTNVNLVALNDFLKAYGKFDVERGVFALYTSIAARDGNYEGYFKVLFEDLDVFDWQKERKKNALQVFWQAIVGTMTTIFKNQPKDRLAAKVPVSGTFEKTDVHLWTAVTTLLRNAFVRALVPKLDQKVTVEDVEEPRRGGEKPIQRNGD